MEKRFCLLVLVKQVIIRLELPFRLYTESYFFVDLYQQLKFIKLESLLDFLFCDYYKNIIY